MDFPIKVLFLCTGNSARSVLGEYLLRSMDSRFWTRSAGAAPTGQVHPLTLRMLAEDYQIDARSARSQSISALEEARFDLVITVCDGAHESCPRFPGATARAHWSLPDPAAASGTAAQRMDVFRAVATRLEESLTELIALPWERLSVSQAADEVNRLAPRPE